MTAATTIKIDPHLKDSLDKLKLFPRETYNEVVSRLVDMAYDQEPLSDETINRIEEALEDFKRGRYYTQEEVEAELGLR
jgi:predicted transcriptional regulator